MAFLSDVPIVLRSYGLYGFARRVWEEVSEDNIFTWAAALAYSWLFAVFPFLIFLMTLLPYLGETQRDTAILEIKRGVEQVFPAKASDVLWENIKGPVSKVIHDRQGKLAPRLIGLGLALWAASGGMSMTMTALDMCYEVRKGRAFYLHRPVAVGMTVVVAGLLLLVVCLLPVGSFVKAWVQDRSPELRGSPLLILFDVVRWPLAILFLIAALSVLYQKGPAVRRRWTWVSPGSVFCAAVWLILALAFKFYVAAFGNFDETYGAVGGVVVLLLFFYIDAAVLLIGAEINSEIDFKILGVDRGSRDYTAAEAIFRPRRKKVRRAGLANNPTVVVQTDPVQVDAAQGNAAQADAPPSGPLSPVPGGEG